MANCNEPPISSYLEHSNLSQYIMGLNILGTRTWVGAFKWGWISGTGGLHSIYCGVKYLGLTSMSQYIVSVRLWGWYLGWAVGGSLPFCHRFLGKNNSNKNGAIFAIMAKMARTLIARIAKMAKNIGKHGEKMLTIFAIMAKMASKCSSFLPLWRKWRENRWQNGENGEKAIFSPFMPFRHGENREKNNKWRMAMSSPIYCKHKTFNISFCWSISFKLQD